MQELSTEQKILDAAEQEFLTEGYAGARMQQIANLAGINKAMLHYYFRSKDKLFELVLKHKLSEFLPQVTYLLHDETVPFMEKLDRFVMAYLGMLRKNPRVPLFLITTLNRNPDLMSALHLQFGNELVALMQREIGKGTIRSVEPHQFFLTVIGMCVFPFLGRPIFRGVFDLSNEAYDRMIQERHTHVMQYARAILQVP